MEASMRNNLAACLLFAAFLAIAATGASAAGRFEGEGVALRLVAEPPGADGRFQAALLVELKPGWKTYWLDPGEAGIPPGLSFEGVADPHASFPVPHRFDDGFATSIVYSTPFAIALEGRAEPGAAGPSVKATLGVCHEICVPVSAALEADYSRDDETRRAVAAAFAALPRDSDEHQGIVAARLAPDGSALLVTVRPMRNASLDVDLFVAASKGWSFGAPVPTAPEGPDGPDGAGRFALPVLARPRKAAAAEPFTVDAILAGPAGAWRASALPVER